MIGSKGRRKPYKIRHFLVNRTSPVLVSSEREGILLIMKMQQSRLPL